MDFLAETLAKGSLPSLRRLSFTGNEEMDDDGLQKILGGLQAGGNNLFTCLEFAFTHVTNTGVRHLANAFLSGSCPPALCDIHLPHGIDVRPLKQALVKVGRSQCVKIKVSGPINQFAVEEGETREQMFRRMKEWRLRAMEIMGRE